ncbi:hypothetical protein GI364_24885 (plasmid) [Alicyclobacillus sp. SO9]|nr:hypothetical protein GI364_24885 [Alicyclobacillus sp. SO9]
MMTVADHFGKASAKKMSDYEKTLFGIAWSVPIMLVVWRLYVWILRPHVGLQTFILGLSPKYHAIWYLGTASIVALIAGYMYGKLGVSLVEFLINLLRGKDSFSYSTSVWETFSGNREEALIRVINLANPTQPYLGTLDRWSTSTESENGLLLKNTDEMVRLNKYLRYPIRTYYNTATNTVYEYFTLNQEKEALKKLRADKGSS